MDNTTLERIATALERIATAMEGGAKAPVAAVQAIAAAATVLPNQPPAATVVPKQPPATAKAPVPVPAPAPAKAPGEPLVRLRNAFIGAMQRNQDAVKVARTKLPGQDFTKFSPEEVEMAISIFDGVTE